MDGSVHALSENIDRKPTSSSFPAGATREDCIEEMLRTAILSGAFSGTPDVRSRLCNAENIAPLLGDKIGCVALHRGGYLLVRHLDHDAVGVWRPGEGEKPFTIDALLSEASSELLVPSETGGDAVLHRPRTGWAVYFAALRSNKRLFVESVVAYALINLFGFASPLAFASIVDKVLPSKAYSSLAVFALGLFGIAAFEFMFGTVRQRLIADIRQRMDHELSFAFFDKLLRLPVETIGQRSSAETLSRFKRIEPIRQFVVDATETCLVGPLFIVGVLMVMAALSIHLTLIVVALTLLYALGQALLRPAQKRWFGEVSRDQESADTTLGEVVRGLETIRAAGASDVASGWWRREIHRLSDAQHHSSRWTALGAQIGSLKDRLLSITAIIGGAADVLAGNMTFGGILAFTMLLRLFSMHADRLVPLWQRYLSLSLSVKRLDEEMRQAKVTETRRTLGPGSPGQIALSRASYRYGTIDAVVAATLTLAPGSMVGIVGPSGAGKSTLLRMLGGVYRPKWGAMSIDGVDLRQLDEDSLRRLIAMVDQDPVFFRRSVVENLRLPRPRASFDEVSAAARQALAHDFIMRLPEQYETVLAEGGRDLSSGQRRCLALARALVARPKVLLMDEFASGLDFETERALIDRLPTIAAGRTVVIVTHRADCLAHATRVLTMQGGRVVEDGAPSALLARGGYFARLSGKSAKETVHAAG
jgi:subfamily B ATP-binding cassette protein HlyB/CyaB